MISDDRETGMLPECLPLGRGMTLYAIRTDKFKTGMLSVSMAKPCDRSLTPATSLLLSVLKRGTKAYPTLAKLNERLDFLYASSLSTQNFHANDNQVMGLYAEFLDSRYLGESAGAACDILDGCVELMSQMLFWPVRDHDGLLCQSYVDSEKKNRRDLILSQQNHPAAYAAMRFAQIMYDREPCGVPLYGGLDDLDAIGRKRLEEVRRYWLDSCAMDFFYVGPLEPERVGACIHRYFEPYCPTSPASYPVSDTIRRAERVRTVMEDRDVTQGKLNMGYRTGVTVHDSDFYAMAVANEIFGSSPVSKLFMNIREKQSLCYAIGSSYDLYKGTMRVSCGIDPDKYDRVREAIGKQWEDICRGRISGEEWQAARQALDNSYRTLYDSPSALCGFYYGRLLEGISATVEDCRAGFAAVTKEQVAQAAQRVSLDTVYFLRGTKTGEADSEDVEDG